MDDKTFELVDGILATKGYHDDRQAAADILEAGLNAGTLTDAAQVVAGRYALQPSVVIEWFGTLLIRRQNEVNLILGKFNALMCCRIGYCVKMKTHYGGGGRESLDRGRCPICKKNLGEINV